MKTLSQSVISCNAADVDADGYTTARCGPRGPTAGDAKWRYTLPDAADGLGCGPQRSTCQPPVQSACTTLSLPSTGSKPANFSFSFPIQPHQSTPKLLKLHRDSANSMKG